MQEVKCIYVGKLKQRFILEGCKHYRAKINKFLTLKELEVKDSSKKEIPSKKREEGKNIVSCIDKKDFPVILSEHGKCPDTSNFASKLDKWLEMPGRRPCFVIAGPYGPSESLNNEAELALSLSPLTFPHELARLILLEQLFRASSILHNFPYHN